MSGNGNGNSNGNGVYGYAGMAGPSGMGMGSSNGLGPAPIHHTGLALPGLNQSQLQHGMLPNVLGDQMASGRYGGANGNVNVKAEPDDILRIRGGAVRSIPALPPFPVCLPVLERKG